MRNHSSGSGLGLVLDLELGFGVRFHICNHCFRFTFWASWFQVQEFKFREQSMVND